MELVEPIAINTKIKNKKDLKESLQILQTWFSPSFPIGSFSYSHGLEAMINDNLIKSKEDILDYLKCILKYGTGKNDIILMKYTCLLYTSPSPRDRQKSRMPSSA